MLAYSKYVQYTEITSIRLWSYNSPLVLLSSFSVFLFFSTLNFQNRIINFLATGTLAAYILHTKDFFYDLRMHINVDVFSHYSYLGLFVFVVIILLGLYFVTAPVEHLLGKFIKNSPNIERKAA